MPTLWFLAYRKEWEELFVNNNYLATIRQKGINGQLRSSRFRSICWKVRRKYLFTVCGCSISTHYLMPWEITHAGDHWIFQETSLSIFWPSKFIFHRTFTNKVEPPSSRGTGDGKGVIWNSCSFIALDGAEFKATPLHPPEASAEILEALQRQRRIYFQLPTVSSAAI